MVDKTNLDELEKTEIYGLTLLDNNHVLDITKVSENFSTIEKVLGNVAELDQEKGATFTDVIKKNSKMVNDVLVNEMEGYDIDEDGQKTLSNYIKYIWKKLSNIELSDEKIDVKSKSKKLNEVLKDIFNSIGILGNLNTLNKTNLVTAINEVLGKTSTNASEIQNNKEKLNVHQQHLESLDSKLTSNNSLFSEYNRRFRELNGGE